MRFFHPGLIGAVLSATFAAFPAWGQTGDPASPAPTVEPLAAPAPPPSPDVLAPPPVADFIVVPLRVHILSATDLPAVQSALSDDDIRRIVAKVNAIWHKAGIHWALDSIVHEPAAHQDRFRTAQAAGAGLALPLFRILAPAESRAAEGVDVYYIHAFPVNGVFFGDRTAFVQETAKLRPVPGGIDEPLPRVTAHELGHALGLPHRQNRTNLLASGTTGTILNQAEVDRVRARAPQIPGAAPVADLRRQLDEARARGALAESARLDAILTALHPEPTAEKPASPR